MLKVWQQHYHNIKPKVEMKCPINRWMNKMWYIYIMEYYFSHKKHILKHCIPVNELWKHYTWVKEAKYYTSVKQPQNAHSYYTHSIFCEVSRTGKFTEKESDCLRTNGGEEQGETCHWLWGFLYEIMKIFWAYMMVIVAQTCEYNKNHCTVFKLTPEQQV